MLPGPLGSRTPAAASAVAHRSEPAVVAMPLSPPPPPQPNRIRRGEEMCIHTAQGGRRLRHSQMSIGGGIGAAEAERLPRPPRESRDSGVAQSESPGDLGVWVTSLDHHHPVPGDFLTGQALPRIPGKRREILGVFLVTLLQIHRGFCAFLACMADRPPHAPRLPVGGVGGMSAWIQSMAAR